jgi:hypothetical protein
MTRPADRRPVFRLALDRVPGAARARLASGTSGAVTLCAFNPARPLFPGDAPTARLRPDFESEAWFGAGWSDVRQTPTGRARRGENGATLLVPLSAGRDYRLWLDLGGKTAAAVSVNGRPAGVCAMGECEILLPAAAVRNGVNEVTLSLDPGAVVMLREATLRRK